MSDPYAYVVFWDPAQGPPIRCRTAEAVLKKPSRGIGDPSSYRAAMWEFSTTGDPKIDANIL